MAIGFPGVGAGGQPNAILSTGVGQIPNGALPTGVPCAVVFPSLAIATAASPADLGTQSVPFARYIVQSVYVESLTAAGTLALGTLDIRTAAAGGGASILTAPVALTSLTGANLAQSFAVPAITGATVATAANLTVRQTVNSANAGTAAVVVTIIPVP